MDKEHKQHEKVKDYPDPKEKMKEPRLKQRHNLPGQDMSMREMAADITRHHLTPAPEAKPPQTHPFPAPVIAGLLAGIIGGVVLGLLVAALLLNSILVVPGWEGLFSMTPATFYTFWAGMGAALGILLGGVAAILMSKVP